MWLRAYAAFICRMSFWYRLHGFPIIIKAVLFEFMFFILFSHPSALGNGCTILCMPVMTLFAD